MPIESQPVWAGCHIAEAGPLDVPGQLGRVILDERHSFTIAHPHLPGKTFALATAAIRDLVVALVHLLPVFMPGSPTESGRNQENRPILNDSSRSTPGRHRVLPRRI
jgi:hypothetical protein